MDNLTEEGEIVEEEEEEGDKVRKEEKKDKIGKNGESW